MNEIISGFSVSGQAFLIQDASAIHNDDGYITSAEVQTLIETSISGKANTSDVYQKSETSSKTEIDSALADKLAVSAFTTYSGTVASELGEKASQSDVDTLSGQIQSISSSTSGDVTAISGDVVTISGDVVTISGDVTAISGDVVTISGDVQTLTNDLTAHTSNTDIHVTTAQTASWDAKSNFSGSYNDLTDKPTIPSIWSGTEAQWSQISGGTLDNNTLYLVY